MSLPSAPEPEVALADLERELDTVLTAWERRRGMEDQASRLRALVESASPVVESLSPVEATIAPEIPDRSQGLTLGVVERTEARHMPTRTARVIAIASGKGGVGKTNTAVNLSIALAAKGLRVTLVDADLGTANADVLCGVSAHARLEHVLTALPVHDGARRSLADIAIPGPGGFRLIPGSAGVARLADLSALEQRHLLQGLCDLEATSDVLVVDAAAGVGRSVISLIRAADLGLVVTTPEPTSIADAYALIKCVFSDGSNHHSGERASSLGLVVNQVVDAAEAQAVHGRISAVCDRFLAAKIGYVGHIAQDLRVSEAVRARRPFMLRTPNADASRNIRCLAETISQQMGLIGVQARPIVRRRFSALLSRLLNPA